MNKLSSPLLFRYLVYLPTLMNQVPNDKPLRASNRQLSVDKYNKIWATESKLYLFFLKWAISCHFIISVLKQKQTNKQKSPGIEVRLAGRLGEGAKGENDFWFISPQWKHDNTHTQAHRRTLNVTFVVSKSVHDRGMKIVANILVGNFHSQFAIISGCLFSPFSILWRYSCDLMVAMNEVLKPSFTSGSSFVCHGTALIKRNLLWEAVYHRKNWSNMLLVLMALWAIV